MLGACRMTVIEMKRGTRRREALLEAWGGVEEAYEVPEPLALDADRLAACLQALSERERTVVVLTFFSESPAGQVGAELNLTAGNVRVVRHRALGRLRECMGLERLSVLRAPLAFETLIAWWLGELPQAEAGALEGHLFSCAHCASRGEELAALAAGVRAAVRSAPSA